MPFRRYTVGAYSSLYTTDVGYLVQPAGITPSSSSRLIIGCHGHGGSGFQYGQSPLEPYVTALVRAGYAVLGIDHARINAWGDPDAMRACDDAYAYAQTLGYTNAKVGMMGWSMGGATVLNWAKRNPSRVACGWLWNPVTDLRFFRDLSGAYTPAYSVGGAGAAQGLYQSEINTTFAPTNTVSGGYTIPALGGAGITMTLTAASAGNAFADGSNSGNVGLPQATVNAVAFTYTGKTDTTLIGCVSTTASTITVTNGMTITSSYAAQSNGYRIQDEPTQWTGLGVKLKVCQASDDTTVAPAMNTDPVNGFVGRVNSPNVTLRSPAPTGGHSLSIVAAQVPLAEVVAFYQANL